MTSSPIRRTALSPLSAGLAAGLNILLLILASRSGNFPDIAGYAAGSALGGVVSGVAGSGTSLAFVTGDERTQAAVRRVRYSVVVPIMLGATMVGAGIYSSATDLPVMAVVFGGVSVAVNNMGELENAVLERNLRTPAILFANTIPRVIGLGFLLAGQTFSLVMLLIALMAFILRRAFVGRGGAFVRPGFRDSVRLAYNPSLIRVSIYGILTTRLPLLAAPFVLNAYEAGVLSTLITGQQSATAILTSALYSIMAASAHAGKRAAWAVRAERFVLALTGVVTIASVCATPLVLRLLGMDSYPRASIWWLLLAIAIAPFVVTRMMQYRFLTVSKHQAAANLLLATAAVNLICCLAAWMWQSGGVLASSSVVGETVGVFVSLWLMRRGLPSSGGVVKGS